MTDLADSCKAIGFSGTDDNRFLLPPDILQISPYDDKLKATNGAMIERIIQCTKSIHILLENEARALWEVVLDQVLFFGTRALIDVGGLMAGVENQEAAMYLAEKMMHDPGSFRGVVYYEPTLGNWSVFELKDKRHQPLRSSSLSEAECFVYFDESRCRGSNMKMLINASALVTLEPKLTKDKFLQGCARMRQLRPDGQTIILAGTAEVLSTDSTIVSVLQQIILNTIEKNQKGLIQWFERGMDHEKFPEPIPTDCSLEYMYSRDVKEYDSLDSYLDDSIEHDASSTKAKQLVEHCKEIGSNINIKVSQLSEECERELEHEEEREEEKEEQLQEYKPHAEEDWEYEDVFKRPGRLFNSYFLKLADVIFERLGSPMSDIQWNNKLYCTPNFWNTVQHCQNPSRFLRSVNTILAASDGRVVLISEYETDKLLPIWWAINENNSYTFQQYYRTSQKTCPMILQHLSMVVSNQGIGKDSLNKLPTDVLTSLKLFRGYVDYGSNEEQNALAKLFNKPNVRSAIQHLLIIRERLRFLDRSDLDIFSLGGRKQE